MQVATTSPSAAIISRGGAAGLTSTMEAVPGGDATFASEVTFTDATAFPETDTIGFGAGQVLPFGAVGNGYLGPSADPTLKYGTVMWQDEGGEGQFASNFFVGEDLAVTDYHVGVLFVP